MPLLDLRWLAIAVKFHRWRSARTSRAARIAAGIRAVEDVPGGALAQQARKPGSGRSASLRIATVVPSAIFTSAVFVDEADRDGIAYQQTADRDWPRHSAPGPAAALSWPTRYSIALPDEPGRKSFSSSVERQHVGVHCQKWYRPACRSGAMSSGTASLAPRALLADGGAGAVVQRLEEVQDVEACDLERAADIFGCSSPRRGAVFKRIGAVLDASRTRRSRRMRVYSPLIVQHAASAR